MEVSQQQQRRSELMSALGYFVVGVLLGVAGGWMFSGWSASAIAGPLGGLFLGALRWWKPDWFHGDDYDHRNRPVSNAGMEAQARAYGHGQGGMGS